MAEIKFTHKVSKGTRFNQIYIPLGMKGKFDVGDVVEVILLEKKSGLAYSPEFKKQIKKLNPFKEELIKNIFSLLGKFKGIERIFIVGSFLTQGNEYNDIDIILVADKDIESEVNNLLIDKFELKFHVISISQKNFEKLIKSCPLTRGMLYFFVSNKEFILLKKREIDKKHIKFLLMMPEDLLSVKLKPRVFYDSLRRLITIERFLEERSLNPLGIEEEIKKLIGDKSAINIKTNEEMGEILLKKIRKVIKSKLEKINKELKN